MSRATPDLTRRRFGRLIALVRVRSADGCVNWKCRCDCGNERIVRIGSLIKGATQSCGCYRRSASQERMRKQGLARAGQKRYGAAQDVMESTFTADPRELLKRLGIAA